MRSKGDQTSELRLNVGYWAPEPRVGQSRGGAVDEDRAYLQENLGVKKAFGWTQRQGMSVSLEKRF